MFGPNNEPSIHHREEAFEELYIDTQQKFCRLARLDEKIWDVFFITGSGSCAIETMLYSVTKPLVVATQGHFSNRVLNYLAQTKTDGPKTRGEYQYVVTYETATSQFNKASTTYNGEILPIDVKLTVTDCVSSFPYYDPQGDMWATVASKQLGCSPGLSIIVMKKELWYNDIIKPADASYMSLAKYKIKDDIHQTPHTPAISLLQDLNKKLDKFDVTTHRKMIDKRREKILSMLPPNLIIGDGPVVTIKNNNYKTTELVMRTGLYNNSSAGPQIFLWSGTDEQYEELYKELEKVFDT